MSDDKRPDPKAEAEAERRLRLMLASEARAQQDALTRVKYGFYGCVTILVVIFLLLLFFS